MAREAKWLIVEGMSCSHCGNRIKKALGELNGVGGVSVDLKSKKVSFEFDSALTGLGRIKDTIEEQGYEVK
jgi:copper chaperone